MSNTAEAEGVQAYGLIFPTDPIAGPATAWSIESTCYAEYLKLPDSHRKQFGREHHLKQLMLMLYPKVLGTKGEKWDQYWEEMTWAFCNYNVTTVMGFAGLGKTFRAAHIVFAAYIASPMNTAVSLTTVTVPALQQRLFADMVAASRNYPGMRVIDYRSTVTIPKPPPPLVHDQRMAITGFATANTKDAAGRIQGLHSPHRYYVIDEGMEVGEAVYNALPNLMVDPDPRGFCLGNPRERFSPFGQKCKPKDGGWNNEVYTGGGHMWEVEGSVPGMRMICLRYDARKSPNYIERTQVQPWAPSREQIEAAIAQRNIGRGELAAWMYTFADFAPDGTIEKVFPQAVIIRGEKRIEFHNTAPTFMVSALDPGFGGDAAVQSFFKAGIIERGLFGLELLEQIDIAIDKGNLESPPDWQVAKAAIDNCKTREIDPSCHITDTTGRGAGVHAMMVRSWSSAVQAAEFGGSPSEVIIRTSDPETPKEAFKYRVDEYWFAASTWMEEGQLSFGGLPCLALKEQLSGRLVVMADNGKRRIEPKDEYKLRLGRSPDEADSFVLGVELMRRKGAQAGLVSKWTSKPETAMHDLATKHALEPTYATSLESAMAQDGAYCG